MIYIFSGPLTPSRIITYEMPPKKLKTFCQKKYEHFSFRWYPHFSPQKNALQIFYFLSAQESKEDPWRKIIFSGKRSQIWMGIGWFIGNLDPRARLCSLHIVLDITFAKKYFFLLQTLKGPWAQAIFLFLSALIYFIFTSRQFL